MAIQRHAVPQKMGIAIKQKSYPVSPSPCEKKEFASGRPSERRVWRGGEVNRGGRPGRSSEVRKTEIRFKEELMVL